MVGVKTNPMSTLLQDQSRALISDMLGLRGNPKCYARPQDPGIQMWGVDTTLFMLGGLQFKHLFVFSIFCFLLAKKCSLKKKSSFLSSFFQVSFVCFFVTSEQDEKDLTEIPKSDTGKASVLPGYPTMRTKSCVLNGRRRCLCAATTLLWLHHWRQ